LWDIVDCGHYLIIINSFSENVAGVIFRGNN